MNRGRVLCCVDEATGSLAGVRGLKAAGYEPWLALSHEHTYVAHSRASAGTVRLPDPTADPEAYSLQLSEAAASIEADVVLPFTEGTLQALSGRDHLFGHVALGMCPPDAVRRATDKGLLAELCAQAGLETPPTVEVNAATIGDRELQFPAVVKPRRSVTAHGATLRREHVLEVNDGSELRRFLAARPEETFFLQPRLEGTLAAICGVAWQGKLVCASHQVSPRIWPTTYGISSFARTVPADDERETGTARLLELVGWSGIFGVQFMLCDGRAHVIDLNPRIYGSAALAIAAGHNLPAIWTDLLLGHRPTVPAYRIGTHYRSEVSDLRAILVEFRRGKRGAAIRGLLPRANTVHAVFSLRDPGPGLEIVRKTLASALPRRHS